VLIARAKTGRYNAINFHFAQPIPRHMTDRLSDAPLTPAEMSRRSVLRGIIGAIAGAISSIVAVVIGGAVLSPAFGQKRDSWVPAGSVRDLEPGVPTAVTVRVTRQDGYYEATEQQVVFLVRTDDGVRALSSTCTHLGCRLGYDRATKLIKCPCHGGVFRPDGTNVSGPPPRPLPHLPSRVEDSKVFVEL
jgi:menaquinol-cytochrome c reductase iron-sulfur subunit